jgi:hypothetical protein
MYAFMWLSATWCAICRGVQPPSRYGVSRRAPLSPCSAARISAGASRIAAIDFARFPEVTFGSNVNLPVGYRRSSVMHAF